MSDETQVLQHDEDAVEDSKVTEGYTPEEIQEGKNHELASIGETVGSDSAQTITVEDAVDAEDQPNR